MKKNRLPIGIEDFKELIEKEYLFFDKTLLIKNILDEGVKVTLFTRPRRFGKTLTLSMIDNFFNIRKKEENKNLFNNLAIMDTEYKDRLGSHPVIYISFKDAKFNNKEIGKNMIKYLISDMYKKHRYVLEVLSEEEKNEYLLIEAKKLNIEDLINVFKNLSEYLFRYHNKKVILLIDEYDTPLVSAFSNNMYDEVKDFITTIYSTALKSNEYLEFAVITGILRVAKEGIFSGLNHLKVNTIFSDSLSEYFGFTHKEVKDVLKLFNLEDKFEDLCKWYDGYSFGNSKIFNPWSIINYLSDKELKPYWVNTGSDELIVNLFKGLSMKDYEKLSNLIDGKEIEAYISENVSLNIINTPENIWMLLLYAGYLTVSKKIDNKRYMLRMVNKEIGESIRDRFLAASYGSENIYRLREMLDLFYNDEIEEFEKELNNLTEINYSYYDFTNEFMHKLYFMTLVRILDNKWIIESEKEAGIGRLDLLFYKENEGYLLEFKNTKNGLKEAKEQIEKKEYELIFKKYGISNYKVYAVNCNNKEMKFERLK